MSSSATAQWTGVLTLSPTTTGDLAYFQDVKERLDDIAELRCNWDGEGGEPISQRILSIAGELLLPLARIQPPVPRIAPVLGGGIQFEWEVAGRELEIEILPDGSVQYLIAEGEVTHEGELAAWPTDEVRRLVYWLTRQR